MKDIARKMDELRRRDFIARVAKTTLGVSLLPTGSAIAAAGDKGPLNVVNPGATCKNVIFLYMQGGMSHLDTFDPKSDSSVKVSRPLPPAHQNTKARKPSLSKKGGQ